MPVQDHGADAQHLANLCPSAPRCDHLLLHEPDDLRHVRPGLLLGEGQGCLAVLVHEAQAG
eukprot:CAMPEP_0119072384 /NCGR_PEP_ID=MMETSP1178-20130426/58336_1 /TAXON_ID=33656 /ORGANISM="unid sp, Strain CCMP2000" /LENGTH=60 /DNA_ID=CAMNT_0007054383 /DNA_START=21 /DNA_END=199 /DNA_ORIENTATION=-